MKVGVYWGLLLLSIQGCSERRGVRVTNEISGIAMEVFYEKKDNIVEVRTKNRLVMKFYLFTVLKDPAIMESVVTKFDFHQLDAALNERWLYAWASMRTANPTPSCPSSTQSYPPVSFTQDKDGTLSFDLKRSGRTLMTAVAKRSSNPGFCVSSWISPEVAATLAQEYEGVYASFIQALTSEENSSGSPNSNALQPDTRNEGPKEANKLIP
jgi:hypothetical protein